MADGPIPSIACRKAVEADKVDRELKGIPPKRAAEKFGRKKSWLWLKVKTDPAFPRPFYHAPHAPLFLESELDAYIARLASERRPDRVAA